jgi:cellulose biosynthesis protein BcsQ
MAGKLCAFIHQFKRGLISKPEKLKRAKKVTDYLEIDCASSSSSRLSSNNLVMKKLISPVLPSRKKFKIKKMSKDEKNSQPSM